MAGSAASQTTKQRSDLFVSSMGENGANELKFFNLTGDKRENQCLKQVELTIDGCVYLSNHSKMHQTILMTSNNGSVFSWSPSPTKIIQALAPGFHELERNIWYVEKEDEFEESFSDDGTMDVDSDFELMPLDEKQKKLAVKELDIDNCSPECITQSNYM